jgi:short-subunit dehydrogenase
MDLIGKTALVTGANRGIGRALTEALSREELGTLLAGVRDVDGFDPISGVEPVVMDLSSRDSIETSFEALGGRPIDVLVNNAGRMTGGLLEDQDLDEIYAMFHVNLAAVVHLTKLVLPGMVERGQGLVVNNASISGYAALPAASTYSAAKHGVVAFSESLRRELRGTGVDVMHLVTPGVKTDMLGDTQEVYGRHMKTEDWPSIPPEQWAAKVVKGMKAGDHIVGPGGRLAVTKLASRGPAALLDALSRQMFTRTPR